MPPLNPLTSPAAIDLGLGDMLGQQVKAETDEERKKRLRQQQMQLSPAATALGLGAAGYGQ